MGLARETRSRGFGCGGRHGDGRAAPYEGHGRGGRQSVVGRTGLGGTAEGPGNLMFGGGVTGPGTLRETGQQVRHAPAGRQEWFLLFRESFIP